MFVDFSEKRLKVSHLVSIGLLVEVEVAHGVLHRLLHALAHGSSLHRWDWLLHLMVHGGLTHHRHIHLVLLLLGRILRRHAVGHGWGRWLVSVGLLLLLLLTGVGRVRWFTW